MVQKDAKKYNNTKLVLSVSEGVLNFLLVLGFLFTGFTIAASQFVNTTFDNVYFALFAYLFILGIISSLITFPISFYKDFTLEHKYDLSNQTLKTYFWEKFKGYLVAIPLLLILLSIFYYLLRNFSDTWWIIMGTVIVVFSVILSRLAPTLIFPLFYKFTPLDNSELEEKVENLCNSVGMELDGLFKFDMSKNTKKANAAFTGIGKSKRIILGDTLLENLTDDEILAVLSHELGHFKLKHIWKQMAFGVFLNYLGLYLVDLFYSQSFHHFGAAKYSLAALPLMALFLTLFSLITTPLSNILSRNHERQADDFAADLTGSFDPLKSGLEKLNKQNLGDDEPNPVVEFLFYSHPSTGKRIARME